VNSEIVRNRLVASFAGGEHEYGGQRKMSQVFGAFGLLDFTTLRPVLARRAF
jgi:hypothetical protein